MTASLLQDDILSLLENRPYLHDFFTALAIEPPAENMSLESFLRGQSAAQLAEYGLDADGLLRQCVEFLEQMELFQQDGQSVFRTLTVKAGCDKNGMPEKQDLLFHAGEVISIVGPTGSGKSRLLADIECLAQRDTPSGRQVLLDGKVPDEEQRFSGERQLVAQLSQNMNFVVDLTVDDFIRMHGESRLVKNLDELVEQVYTTAVDLAGEPFDRTTPVTALSGGQSRALMIADVAWLSASPIVLIDEIENAGVDRLRALDLLLKKEKIVLIATHDPLLALSADRRLVIRNGGVEDVLVTDAEERAATEALAALDKRLSSLRDRVRSGERVRWTG